jgi:hypothetical protein
MNPKVGTINPATPPWDTLLEAARWAPSPHNTQPWRLAPIDDHRADLFLDRARALPDEDTTGAFLLCAMGIFTEALSIAAAEHHMRLHVVPRAVTGTHISGPTRGTEPLVAIASLTLEHDNTVTNPFTTQDLIERRTSRLSPDPRPIAESVLNSLAAQATADGLRFGWVSDPAQVARLVELNFSAVFHDLNHPPYRREFASWLRYSARQEHQTSDGLSARCMNIPAHELRAMNRFPDLFRWRPTRPLMRALYRRRLGAFVQMGYLAAPFFDRGTDIDLAFEIGRAFLRFWLSAHRAGIGIHPFGNLVTNADAYAEVRRMLANDAVWIVFRFGQTATPPRSLRLPKEALLCERCSTDSSSPLSSRASRSSGSPS